MTKMRITADEDGEHIDEGIGEMAEMVAERPVRDEREVASETVSITLIPAVGPEDWDLHVLEGTDISSGLLPSGRVVIGDIGHPDAVLSWSTQYDKPFVHNVWVAEDLRKRGVARILYDAFRRHVSEHVVSVGPWSPGGYATSKALSDEVLLEPPEQWKSKKEAQQKDYPTKYMPGEYTKTPEPVGYVYHVSPYAENILEEGFTVDPSRRTLGQYGDLCSISTTTYENAVRYRDGIRTIVNAVNGTLGTAEMLDVMLENGIDNVSYQVMFYSAMESRFGDWARQGSAYVRPRIPEQFHPENYNYDWIKSPDGSAFLEYIARNGTDFDGNALSQDEIANRNWWLMKYAGPYSGIPFVCNQLPPHLKTRKAEDVQIVEVAVAPAEYSESKPDEEEGKSKYTYNKSEKEWRHYDVTDLWPTRIIE
jgi:hypothetical protein